jgi:hypothetical protein
MVVYAKSDHNIGFKEKRQFCSPAIAENRVQHIVRSFVHSSTNFPLDFFPQSKFSLKFWKISEIHIYIYNLFRPFRGSNLGPPLLASSIYKI